MRWSATVSLLTLGLALAQSPPAEARRVYGATIPDPSDPQKTDGHFIVRKSFDKALRELRRTYGNTRGVVIRTPLAPPRVRARYVENTRANRTWDGINLYEDPSEGVVYISVLPALRKDRPRASAR